MNEIEAAFADELMPSVERGATQLVLMHMPLVRLKTMSVIYACVPGTA